MFLEETRQMDFGVIHTTAVRYFNFKFSHASGFLAFSARAPKSIWMLVNILTTTALPLGLIFEWNDAMCFRAFPLTY